MTQYLKPGTRAYAEAERHFKVQAFALKEEADAGLITWKDHSIRLRELFHDCFKARNKNVMASNQDV